MLLSPGSFLGGKNHASPSVAAKQQLPVSEEAASRETALLSPCHARRAAAVLPQTSGLEADLHGGASRATLLASSMCPRWAGVLPLWLVMGSLDCPRIFREFQSPPSGLHLPGTGRAASRLSSFRGALDRGVWGSLQNFSPLFTCSDCHHNPGGWSKDSAPVLHEAAEKPQG